ncbi:MAG: mannose-6-phosphate isomerase [Pelagibacteraceae bacterium]|jgi:mannose-1-phosphate guanylyltransferase/mannose-6-phosphate isomerase|nr:mannose-6-phosphate isomerase [Pelagibacteraceae bacterium]
MKIKPVIICGGAGTRLWPQSKNNLPKQFINFGGWTLFEKTLQRIKSSTFDYPIISTNLTYVNLVRKYLLKCKIKKFKIILEPSKKNTAPAILTSALLKEIPHDQSMIFFSADHLIKKKDRFNKSIISNKKYLNENNIFIFGIKPTSPSSEYGYFLTKKISKSINKVDKFIEKPNINKAKKIIKKNGYWNSGMFFARKDSILNNFKKYQPQIFKLCNDAVNKSIIHKNVYHLNKHSFKKLKEKSFDYAILEKSKNINGIKLNIPWSDLGSWKEISNIFNKNKSKYFRKSNVFYRPWGKYINLYSGNGFLVKELVLNPMSSISLQKHKHRSEHWTITSGKPIITINKKKFFKNINETAFIPKGAIHRVENPFKKPVKIMEIQTGAILKETDIIRYQDVYGRVK